MHVFRELFIVTLCAYYLQSVSDYYINFSGLVSKQIYILDILLAFTHNLNLNSKMDRIQVMVQKYVFYSLPLMFDLVLWFVL